MIPKTPDPRKGNDPGADDAQLARVVDELAERLCEGERLDWPTCLKEHPGHAAALNELAPAIEILVLLGKEGASPGERPAGTDS
jgi:hypothetical protein